MKYLLLFFLLFPAQCFALDSNKLVTEIDIERWQIGVPLVFVDERLSHVAYLKAKDMVFQNYWAHNNNGNTWSFLQASGYRYLFAGEIIVRYATTEKQAVSLWLDSPSHKAVLVNPFYNKIGVGTYGDITVVVMVYNN